MVRISLLVLALLALAGCSCSPTPPKPPALSAGQAAAEAMKLYDANRDGKVDGTELKKSPPLASSRERIDTDGDGALSEAEIAARIRSWADSGTIVANATAIVRLDGQPLEGASLIFEPEPFLGPSFQNCTGTTRAMGYADISAPSAEFPGLYLGLYRVRISKPQGGQETLPARYNTETELGVESATDVGGIGTITFDLKSQ